MNLFKRRRAAALAQSRLLHEQRSWNANTYCFRARVAAQRAWLIPGTGFAAGMLWVLLPLRRVGQAVGLFARATSFVLRMPIGALLADESADKDAAIRRADTRA
jgi:hypothetical protein